VNIENRSIFGQGNGIRNEHMKQTLIVLYKAKLLIIPRTDNQYERERQRERIFLLVNSKLFLILHIKVTLVNINVLFIV